MGRLGLPELIVILVIVIIIFGANRLPELGKGIGSAIKNATTDPDEVASATSSTQLGVCANCGTANPVDSRFCRKCGNKL